MRIHLIEGAAGCEYAVQNRCVAIVVDALRASATATMLLQAGAEELLVVREIADAFEAKRTRPDALLFGERGGLPPEGFDGGNSPENVGIAKGRRVVFTTTTGAQRLIASWGAEAVYMGSTVNASAVLAAATSHGRDVVIIPAGLATDPTFNAQEDWTAAVAIALKSKLAVDSGAERYDYWRARIANEGIGSLFASAPHAAKLIPIGLGNDISFCAKVDITNCVPLAVAADPLGIVVKNAPA
jgi:2-phosphosulfolactate phosphatase